MPPCVPDLGVIRVLGRDLRQRAGLSFFLSFYLSIFLSFSRSVFLSLYNRCACLGMGHAAPADRDHARIIGAFNLIAVESPFKIYSKVPVAFVDGKTEFERTID